MVRKSVTLFCRFSWASWLNMTREDCSAARLRFSAMKPKSSAESTSARARKSPRPRRSENSASLLTGAVTRLPRMTQVKKAAASTSTTEITTFMAGPLSRLPRANMPWPLDCAPASKARNITTPSAIKFSATTIVMVEFNRPLIKPPGLQQQGLKPQIFLPLAARLKSCPDTNRFCFLLLLCVLCALCGFPKYQILSTNYFVLKSPGPGTPQSISSNPAPATGDLHAAACRSSEERHGALPPPARHPRC